MKSFQVKVVPAVVRPCNGAPAAAFRRVVVLALTCALALSVFGGASAQAAPKPINGFIGDKAGVNTGGLFSQPRDVAVYVDDVGDPSDDKIFVVEGLGNNSRVQRLDADGNFELMWGRDVVRPGAPGNVGTGYEICSADEPGGAANCKSAPSGTAGGEFDDPMAIAVNQSTGDVYVRDRDNRRVQQFDSDGDFIRAWGWDVVQAGGTGDDTSLPIDEFEICTIASECKAGTAGTGNGQFGTNGSPGTGIAVDPVNGDVFAADPATANRRVQWFSSSGTYQSQFGTPGPGPAVGQFGGAPMRLAVDSNHIVYVSDTNNSNRIQRYDAGAAVPDFLPEIQCCAPTPGAPLVPGVTTGLEIDPTTGNLLVARDPDPDPDPDAEITVIQELDIPSPATDPVTTVVENHPYAVDLPAPEDNRSVNGIGVSPTTGYIYLAAPIMNPPPYSSPPFAGTFSGCEDPDSQVSQPTCSGLIVLALTTGPLTATLDVPVDVGATTVSLDGEVNPGGGVARYRFQVSTDGSTWTDVSQERYEAGSSDVAVSAEVTGLEPATPYQARLLVRKQTAFDATTEASQSQMFTTDAAPPDVRTLASTQRRATSVRLRGLVDPNGADTDYHFEYGLQGGPLNQQVPVPAASAGDGNSLDLVVQDLTGLTPSTAYDYRIVATNSEGTDTGDVESFTTTPPSDDGALPPRGYELVSPADKVSGVGVGAWFNGPAVTGLVGFGAHDGERFAVQGTQGAVLIEGEYAYANDWAMAERTAAGWMHRPGVSRRAYDAQPKTFLLMATAAPDLSLMSWTSNAHTLAIFPEMEGWEDAGAGEIPLLRDWTAGKWEVIGPTDPDQGRLGTQSVGIAPDGSMAVASGTARGVTGPGDPSLDTVEGNSVYLDDVSAGLSDTFPGAGIRSLVNACTPGTVIPARIDVGGGVFKQATAPCPDAAPGRDAGLISSRGASHGTVLNGVISEGGRRVFFMSPDPGVTNIEQPCGTVAPDVCPPQLYVRQRNSNGEVMTRWISRTEVTQAAGAAADQDSSLMAQAIFEGASSDGDKVFFRTASPLTADDPNGESSAPAGGIATGVPDANSWDLYMYDMPDGPDADPADGDLIRISGGPDREGDCNSPLDGSFGAAALRFLSEDGSRFLFTCAAPLPGVPQPASGTVTEPGGTRTTTDASNLYSYDAARPAAQRWRFVARVPRTSTLGGCATTASQQGASLGPANDAADDVSLYVNRNCVRGTQDGSLITFWTDGQLTSDDPDASTGDIYAYDADRDELTRVTAPRGSVDETYPCALGTNSVECYGDGGFGAAAGETALPRLGVAIDPDGERLVFFQSQSRLVPEDTDTAYDVYQWRANEGPDGELSLITTGTDHPDGAFFSGNDRTGLNVYLATRQRLTWQDHDSVLDVYTARVGGGIPQPEPHERCQVHGGNCQGPGAAAAPVDVDSNGAGGDNVAPVRKTLKLTAPSAKARRKAARTGVLPVRIRLSAPGVVRITAKAGISGKTKRIASARRRLRKAGAVTVKLRLSKAARTRLKSGRALRVRLTIQAQGARPQVKAVVLKRGNR